MIKSKFSILIIKTIKKEKYKNDNKFLFFTFIQYIFN